MNAGPSRRRVMISCGEASGDLYAGALTTALRAADPEVEVFGFGGAHLAGAGAVLVGHYEQVAVTGLSEALKVVPRALRLLGALEQAARTRRPDVFVAIDAPDFNLRLLPRLHRLGVPIVYYVSPQIWAWRASRLEQLRRHVDRMLVIFPFEAPLYERAGVPVEFIGHPLVELARASGPRTDWLRTLGLDPTRPVLGLLPGSRRNEVHRILPVLLGALPSIRARVPDVQFLLARGPSLPDALFDATAVEPDLTVVAGATDDVLQAADAVVTAAGTATVQTALHGRPMVIVYRVTPSTYALGRRFVKLPAYGMVNLIAGRPIVPELIQHACTSARVADEAVSLLTDSARIATMRRDLVTVREALGGPGASARAARAVLQAARPLHETRLA